MLQWHSDTLSAANSRLNFFLKYKIQTRPNINGGVRLEQNKKYVMLELIQVGTGSHYDKVVDLEADRDHIYVKMEVCYNLANYRRCNPPLKVF